MYELDSLACLGRWRSHLGNILLTNLDVNPGRCLAIGYIVVQNVLLVDASLGY